jgi:hypothetical protein
MTARAGRPLVRALRWADRALGRATARRTVLVEARTPMNLAVLRPVFEPLLLDPRLRVRFTGPLQDLRQAFAELDIAARAIPRSQATWSRVDLYMNADPWEAVPLKRVDKQLNFFHGVAGKYDLDCPAGLPLGFGRYDRVAFPNQARRDAYVAAGIVHEARAELVGYPKVDALAADCAGPRVPASSLGLDASRPTAIFAPTFSPASALNQAGEAIVETLLTSGCNVIVKLHDRSLDPDPRYSGGVDWRQRLARYAGPQFLLAGSGDSTPFVLASDLMVTDHSSIGFEFCVLDRPLIVYDTPGLVEAARINRSKVALLRSAAAVTGSPSGLREAVRLALASPSERSAERRKAAAEVFYRPGGATGRALRVVYDLLQLTPRADLVPVRTQARAI